MKKMKVWNVFLSVVLCFVISVGCSSETNESGSSETSHNQGDSSNNGSQEQDQISWPERTINIVVGFGAGGNTDLVSRTLASLMSETLGQNITVTNMPGGTGGIAADHVLKSKNDGYTLLGVPESLRILAVAGYHPSVIGKDWHPLIAAQFDGVISVPKNSPFNDFNDLLEQARNKPNSIKFSASSAGTIWHVQSQIMSKKANVPMQFIPYQGSHPAQTAALSGEVSVVHTGLGEQAELIRAGELRPLAMFSDHAYEMDGVGKIPPITEYLPELKEYLPLSSWIGLAIPFNVEESIKAKIEEAYLKAVQSNEFKQFVKEREGIVLGYDLQKSLETGKQETSVISWLLYDLGIVPKSPEEFNIPKP